MLPLDRWESRRAATGKFDVRNYFLFPTPDLCPVMDTGGVANSHHGPLCCNAE